MRQVRDLFFKLQLRLTGASHEENERELFCVKLNDNHFLIYNFSPSSDHSRVVIEKRNLNLISSPRGLLRCLGLTSKSFAYVLKQIF